MTAKMVEALDLAPADVLVDLGGGTGMYSADILDQVPLESPVVLVDPFVEMLAQAPAGGTFERLQLDAIGFSERPGAYDKVLIKEAVHHVDDKARLFANLFERLRPGGAVLLVHIPPEIDYPLFRAAIERSRRWHSDPDELVRLLGEAGFAVERDALRIRHRLPKRHYFRMVEARYMSLLSSFSEDELAAGLAEMATTHAETEVLEFTDHFDFITGRKALAGGGHGQGGGEPDGG